MKTYPKTLILLFLVLLKTQIIFPQWVQTNGPSGGDVRCFSISGTNIFAGTDGKGVFLSTNNGTNWTKVNNDMPKSLGGALAISGAYIFDGTGGSSVWKRPLSEFTGVSKEVKELPQDYSLYQNYPNPFNPATTISYRLKDKGFVKLNVYDITGKLIKALVNQTKDPGYYETQFNATGLASGVYFYRLEVFGKGSTLVYSDMKK